MTEPVLLACHECDLVQKQVMALPGASVRCRRCNGLLYRHPDKPLDTSLAWSLAGLVLLAIANFFPVLNLSIGGQVTQTSLFSGAMALYRAGQFGVAVLVIGILVVAPVLLFLIQISIFLPLRNNRLVAHYVPMMRILSVIKHWLMFDVFMLAVIVAVVKLSSLAEVIPGIGLWAFLALMLSSILSLRAYDMHALWQRYGSLSGHIKSSSGYLRVGTGVTARMRGLVGCHTCGLVSVYQYGKREQRCPRCSSLLHSRKADSLGRTWALLIAGYVLFIPANLLPITITSSLFGVQPDTIMSGVVYFWQGGAYDLAIIIFTASVFVPLLKLLSLTYLAYSAQVRMKGDPLQRTRLYRIVEFVGKWSMLDIFVVALLAQLVQFSSLAAISPGPGAIAFAAVVVVTIFAAMSFDPRLIWDPQEYTEHTGELRG